MKNFLITGATGFVGAHVVRSLLKENKNVSAIVRTGSDLFRLEKVVNSINIAKVDSLNSESLKRVVVKHKPDVVIHCAAYGVDYKQQDPKLAFSTNIDGTYKLFTASAESGVQRFIQIGSCFEYGSKRNLISENESLEPNSLYAVTKAAASLLVCEWARRLGLGATVLRLFGMWGTFENPCRLVPQVIKACLKKTPLKLTDCCQIRDYTFVSDMADAIVAVATSLNFPSGEIINVGSGQAVMLRDFVLSIAKRLKGEEFMKFDSLDRRPDEMEQLVACCDKWQSFNLPPVSKISLDEAIERVVYG